MKLSTIIRLLWPLAILILSIVGYFSTLGNFFVRNLFLAIGIINVLTQGIGSIKKAIDDIKNKVQSKL